MHNLMRIAFIIIATSAFLWAANDVINLDYVQYQPCSYSEKTQHYCNENETPIEKNGTVKIVISEDSILSFTFTPEYTYRFRITSVKKSTNGDGAEIAIVTGYSAKKTKFMLILGNDYFNLVNSKKWALYFLEKDNHTKKKGLEKGDFGEIKYSIAAVANCTLNRKTQEYEDNCDFNNLDSRIPIVITTKMRRDNLYLVIDTLPEISVYDVQKDTLDNGESILIYSGFDTEGDEVSVVIGAHYFNLVVDKEKITFTETPFKNKPARRESWTGSGVAITKDVLITNAHVAKDVSTLELYLDGNKIPIKGFEIVGAFSEDILDLAIVRIKGAKLDACPISPNEPKLGEDILVYGYPQIQYQGTDLKVTKGIVSGKNGLQGDESSFQIDAAIQHGNSGGPIVANGKIIGLATAFLKDSQNVNFGVKSSKIFHLLKFYGISQKPTTKDFSKCTYMLIGRK